MAWRIRLSRTARKQLANVPQQDRERVIAALDRLADDPYQTDIRKLTGSNDEWRLRVGQWRVRFSFDYETNAIDILRVLPRGRAYRD